MVTPHGSYDAATQQFPSSNVSLVKCQKYPGCCGNFTWKENALCHLDAVVWLEERGALRPQHLVYLCLRPAEIVS